jgi:GntR family transcriptional regulator
LPSIREMASELKVSVITVKRAYSELESEGLIMTRAGLGSFVAEVDQEQVKMDLFAGYRLELENIIASAKAHDIPLTELKQLFNQLLKEDGKKKGRN